MSGEGVLILVSLAVSAALLAMWVIALVDVTRRPPWEFPALANGGDSRSVWLFVVIVGNGIGSLVYYLLVMRPYPRER